MAIKSIRHKGLRRLYEEDDSRAVQAALANKLRDMLHALDVAVTIDEVETVPGWRLHPLKGDLGAIGAFRSAAIGASSFASRMGMRSIST